MKKKNEMQKKEKRKKGNINKQRQTKKCLKNQKEIGIKK